MADMRFEAVLELVDKASPGLRQFQANAKGADGSAAAAARASSATRSQANAASAAAAAGARGAVAAERVQKAELAARGSATGRLGAVQHAAAMSAKTEVSLGRQVRHQRDIAGAAKQQAEAGARVAAAAARALAAEERGRAIAEKLGAGSAFDKALLGNVVRSLASDAAREILDAHKAVQKAADAGGGDGDGGGSGDGGGQGGDGEEGGDERKRRSAKALADVARRREAYRRAEGEEQRRRNAARKPWWDAYRSARRAGVGTPEDIGAGASAAAGAASVSRMARAAEGARVAAVGFGTALGAALGMAAKLATLMLAVKAGAAAAGAVLAPIAAAKIVGSAKKYDDERLVALANGATKADVALRQQQAFSTASRLGTDPAETLKTFRQLREAGVDPLAGSFDYVAARAAKTGAEVTELADKMVKALKGDASDDELEELGLKGNKAFEAAAKRKDKRGVDKALGDQWKKDNLGTAADARAQTVTGQIAQIAAQWERFKAAVADAGVYDAVIDKMKELNGWIEARSKDGSFKNWAQSAGTWITEKLAQLDSLATKISEIATSADQVAQAFGGWKVVLGVIAGLMMLNGVISLLSGLFAIVSGLAIVFGALSAPVLGVVAAIAAVATAAYLIYQNWGAVKEFFSGVWESIKAGASAAGDWIVAKLSAIKAGIVAAIEGARAAIQPVLDGLASAFEAVFSRIEKGWAVVKGIAGIAKAAVESGRGTGLPGVDPPGADPMQRTLDHMGRNAPPSAAGPAAPTIDPAAAQAATAAAQAAQAAAQGAGEAFSALQAKFNEVKAAIEGWNPGPSIQAAMNNVRAVLAGTSFHAEGAAMMETLAAGIKSRAAAAVAAVRDTVQQMRNLLPHSPAKEGPLSDLDQVRFSETLASAIRVEPAVRAASAVAAGMRAAISNDNVIGGLAMRAEGGGMSPVSIGSGAREGSRPPMVAGARAGGALTVNYSPQLSVAEGANRSDFLADLEAHKGEVVRLVREAQDRHRQLAFGGDAA